jgi:hypothetical protein
VSPVRYELGFYIPEDGILHSHRRENLRSYRLYCILWCVRIVNRNYIEWLERKENFHAQKTIPKIFQLISFVKTGTRDSDNTLVADTEAENSTCA